MNKKIEQGQIWIVNTDKFLTSGKKEASQRSTLLKKGEKIEIRFPYAWHFRTEDDIYFHAEPEMIQENCSLFGDIWEDVRFGNNATLEEILRLKLYTGANQ